MVVVSLNLSRRPFKFGFRPLQKIVDRAFGRYDAIVVHSTPEVAGFVDLHWQAEGAVPGGGDGASLGGAVGFGAAGLTPQ